MSLLDFEGRVVEPKLTPPVEDVAEKAPAEMVEPEWMGVMPPDVLRLLDEVCTRRAPVSPPRDCWVWCCCCGKWPVDWGAPMPARACAACIREEEAGTSGVLELECERWWRPWRGISGKGIKGENPTGGRGEARGGGG